MSREKTVKVINKEEHKWWHSFVPNAGVHYETIKEKDRITTLYRCTFCNWQKVIEIVWKQEVQNRDDS